VQLAADGQKDEKNVDRLSACPRDVLMCVLAKPMRQEGKGIYPSERETR
jgi:hypothetical protein